MAGVVFFADTPSFERARELESASGRNSHLGRVARAICFLDGVLARQDRAGPGPRCCGSRSSPADKWISDHVLRVNCRHIWAGLSGWFCVFRLEHARIEEIL